MHETPAAPLLELRGISKTFPGVKALRDVQLTARAGQIHALMGENGAGKSTLMKILSGAYLPDPGAKIRIGGQPARIEGREQVRHDQVTAAPDIHQRGTHGQLREQPRVEDAARRIGERQQAHQHVTVGQEGREFPGACAPLEDGGLWQYDLQGAQETTTPLSLAFDPAEGNLHTTAGNPAPVRTTLSLSLSGLPSFCAALREAFALD